MDADDQGRAEGHIGALTCVGLLSLEDAQVWRAELSRAAREPAVVDAASFENAAAVLSGLLDAVGEGETWERLACARFQGALLALSELGAVDRDHWAARLLERCPSMQEALREAEGDEACAGYAAAGTEQELVGVIAGSSELLEGWRVLYGLRFEDGISFTFWRDPYVRPRAGPGWWHEPDPLGALDLRDGVGTAYGSGSEWGAWDYGARGVSFSTPPPEHARWVELVTEAGHTLRLSL
jgi:hypothetical protein